MTTLDCFGTTVTLNDEGYIVDGSRWTPEVAEAIAAQAGISRLTRRHWKVIAECREEVARGHLPLNRVRIAARTHLAVDELEQLFPGNTEQTIARVAGLPGPGPG